VDVIQKYFPALLRGFLTTLHLTLNGFLIGVVIGIVIAVLRVSPIRPMRLFATAYTSLMVYSPLLFLVFFMFYGIPKLGFLPNNFMTASLAVGIYLGAYIAEALRSGFNSVSNGQAEAARALGLSFGQVLGSVVLPQAVRSSVGPLSILLNATYRNVAVAGIIGVNELVKVGSDSGEESARQYPFFIASFLTFAALSAITGLGAGWLEKRVAIKR
jgi:glutamate transport system permease protein